MFLLNDFAGYLNKEMKNNAELKDFIYYVARDCFTFDKATYKYFLVDILNLLQHISFVSFMILNFVLTLLFK
jgi:hypothetical protein